MQKTIKQFKKLLGEMSFYNAAEGNWLGETDKRENCKVELKRVAKILIDNNIDVDKIAIGNYLISKYDYK